MRSGCDTAAVVGWCFAGAKIGVLMRFKIRSELRFPLQDG
jgi:hypothetical protein